MTKDTDRILFVLVLYGCRLEESASYTSLLAGLTDEHSNIFVYDNSPEPQQITISVGAYISNTGNGGLGLAYNEACRYAEANGYYWLLLLDQDTTFPPCALSSYRHAADRHPEVEMIVPRHRISDGRYLSPTRYRMKTSSLQDSAPTGYVTFREAAPINSGIMVSVRSFTKAGGYDEQVFLDFSDIRFIEKYRRHYSSFYVMPDVVCIQQFSGTEQQSDKVFRRFKIYLKCAANYPKESLSDALALTVTTLRPTLSSTLRERTLRYVKAWWKIYLMRKNKAWKRSLY